MAIQCNQDLTVSTCRPSGSARFSTLKDPASAPMPGHVRLEQNCPVVPNAAPDTCCRYNDDWSLYSSIDDITYSSPNWELVKITRPASWQSQPSARGSKRIRIFLWQAILVLFPSGVVWHVPELLLSIHALFHEIDPQLGIILFYTVYGRMSVRFLVQAVDAYGMYTNRRLLILVDHYAYLSPRKLFKTFFSRIAR